MSIVIRFRPERGILDDAIKEIDDQINAIVADGKENADTEIKRFGDEASNIARDYQVLDKIDKISKLKIDQIEGQVAAVQENSMNLLILERKHKEALEGLDFGTARVDREITRLEARMGAIDERTMDVITGEGDITDYLELIGAELDGTEVEADAVQEQVRETAAQADVTEQLSEKTSLRTEITQNKLRAVGIGISGALATISLITALTGDAQDIAITTTLAMASSSIGLISALGSVSAATGNLAGLAAAFAAIGSIASIIATIRAVSARAQQQSAATSRRGQVRKIG